MRRGFDFDASLCVACQTCNAACTLENGMQPGIRRVMTWNRDAVAILRVINLSMACNHCEKPVCMEGCPAKAYTREATGAVVHHAERCIGCRYCTWECPYDAPRINEVKGYIEKCHFCAERTAEGVDPACVTACPTGALKINCLDEFPVSDAEWFPEPGIGPSVNLAGVSACHGPLIIPGETEEDEEPSPPAPENWLKKEWSLLLFSVLVISASAVIISNATGMSDFHALLPVALLASAIAISFFHLGVPHKAYRATLNIFSSPLSRETVLLFLLTTLAITEWIGPGTIHPFVLTLAALITLISIDLVFFSADKSRILRFHSGQAFFSGIFAASWIMMPRTVFLIFSMMAAVSVVIRHRSVDKNKLARYLYYLRALSLPLVFMLMYTEIRYSDALATVVFIAGAIADRILFFDDFNPANIRTNISQHFHDTYEKERDKQLQNAGLS